MSSDKKKAQRTKGRKGRFLLAFISLVIFVGLSSVILKKLQADVWHKLVIDVRGGLMSVNIDGLDVGEFQSNFHDILYKFCSISASY